MTRYLICEIAGKQYKIEPKVIYLVNYLGEVDDFECQKVLAKADGDKFEVGSPYLKEKVAFEVLGSKRAEKIRVATYKPKANERRVKGSRQTLSQIRLKV